MSSNPHRPRAVGLALAAAAAALILGPGAGYDNGAALSRTPMLGWSSWVALGPGSAHPRLDFCDAASIMAAADAMVETGLVAAGYKAFHLDDCWQGSRNASGHLLPEADHFPDGMRPVIDYVKSRGMVFGLYTDRGNLSCVRTRPGSQGYFEQDARTFADWGVQWVKMDKCNSIGDRQVKAEQEAYSAFSRALNATGVPIHFNMCGDSPKPWLWASQYMQSWRTGDDHTGTWGGHSGTKAVIRDSSAAIPAAYSGAPFGWNDMDMLQTGNTPQNAAEGTYGLFANMTFTEFQTEYSMWAISASHLIITAPIMNCSEAASPPAPCPPPPEAGCHVTLTRQLSQAPCIVKETYDCYGGEDPSHASLWLSGGCRGEFVCGGGAAAAAAAAAAAGRAPLRCTNASHGPVHSTTRYWCPCTDRPPPPPPPPPPAPPSRGPKKCVPSLNAVQKRLLFNVEVIAINQDVTPQGRPVHDGDLQVWSRRLSDHSIAIALYNEDDVARHIALNFTSLGWAPATTASVRNLWERKDEAEVTGGLAPRVVEPHGTVLLRLRAVG